METACPTKTRTGHKEAQRAQKKREHFSTLLDLLCLLCLFVARLFSFGKNREIYMLPSNANIPLGCGKPPAGSIVTAAAWSSGRFRRSRSRTARGDWRRLSAGRLVLQPPSMVPASDRGARVRSHRLHGSVLDARALDVGTLESNRFSRRAAAECSHG